jgi:hypothetical protein
MSSLDMADDAGALLVRSGLVPSTALDDARVRVTTLGGTLGEQLVWAGTISDDALTDFYRSRLLVPQVNPNTLARLPVRVVSAIPSDMAIELRAIPVSLDADNNLTVAMSDPSDSHAVDEIAFFTGTYVVRAVATQMQIAWCLAHYYGHVTALGQKLLQPTEEAPPVEPPAPAPAPVAEVPQRVPRVKGFTSKIAATRHRGVLPITGPVNIPRPDSSLLDDPTPSPPKPEPEPAPAPAPIIINAVAEPIDDAVPDASEPLGEPVPLGDKPRARSISGEIRIPVRRAPSIKPAEEDPYGDDDESPVITIEVNTAEEDTSPRKVPVKRRKVKTDPPELAARSGEVDSITGPVTRVDLDEPRIIINDESPSGADVSGELKVIAHREHAAPATTIEVDDTSVGVVIHEHYKAESEPVVLDRRRETTEEEEDDDGEVVILDAVKRKQGPEISPPRPEKKTQMGMVAPRSHRDTEAGGGPDEDFTGPTRLDAYAAPDGDEFSDEIAAPPPPIRDEDTSPHVLPPSLSSVLRADTDPPARPTPLPRAVSQDDEDGGRVTMVMSAVELDEAIPDRADAAAILAAKPVNRQIDYDPVDEGWGPPGTTIPPPLLGAIPGSHDEASDQHIPLADVDSAPLIVAPPSPPEPARGAPLVDRSAPSLVRALEEATSRSIEVIHALERAHTRDEVISLMSTHLAQTHRRAGFFSIKNGELTLFSSVPKSEIQNGASLRLDRPSTLQDVVGTRLQYRGPMHDDASRSFLTSALGSCPPEILLVPVAVRERVVGVLFGEHRLLHTFDDQLALAARAAGMAFERILKQRSAK